MSNEQPQKIQLTWQDPHTGEQRKPILNLPIALGRLFAQMPASIEDTPVSRIVIDDYTISRYHALIKWQEGNLVVIDQNSVNGTFVNDVYHRQKEVRDRDVVRLGNLDITVTFLPKHRKYLATTVSSDPESDSQSLPVPDPQPPVGSFPPSAFLQAEYVSLAYLQQSGFYHPGQDQFDYAAVGAGLGSYIWVDYLRIFGVKPHQIVALGIHDKPYAKYKQLCLNSQIPLDERLRSNSDSCPDNIWGYPSYAIREAWHEVAKGRLGRTLKYLWQVFAEPTFVETYTPRAGNVFDSIEREAQRIGWQYMYRYGSVRAIRKTDDGRYAIAYSRGGGKYGIAVAKYVHLATGYPAIRFLKHLQEYRDVTKDVKLVVNAYETHDHIYQQLINQGGVVLMQGRGIVASRILQKLYEVRKYTKADIEVIHLMRSPIADSQGSKFGFSKRRVKHNWEFQPFNWPKACWGGDLRETLAKANPSQRLELIKAWGGTTTADRRDWQDIITSGLRERWYRIEFGTVQKVKSAENKIQVTYQETNGNTVSRQADFIIDATGLDADVHSSPLLQDLIEQYHLPLTSLGKQPGMNDRLQVDDNFEVGAMASQEGSSQAGGMYAAGTITLGSSYAAVDSFLGLQYAALQSVDSLCQKKAPGLRYLNGLSSLAQWYKWVRNKAP